MASRRKAGGELVPLAGSRRSAAVERATRETRVKLAVDLDGRGTCSARTGVPFLDHMLEQVARHALLDLVVDAQGDLAVDAHHTVEDVGITLGQAVRLALGDGAALTRYGDALVPLDESLAQAVVDLSGRPHLTYRAARLTGFIGGFDAALVRDFFQAFVNHVPCTLHLSWRYGRNLHHGAEAMCKAFARALLAATRIDSRREGPTSTKGRI